MEGDPHVLRDVLLPRSVWGSTAVLFLNLGIFYATFVTYVYFKAIHYLKFRWVFKFGSSTPVLESPLFSPMLQRTDKWERGRPGHNRESEE